MRTPEHDYKIQTVRLLNGDRLVAQPPLDVVVGHEDNLWVAWIPALGPNYRLYSESIEALQRGVIDHLRTEWKYANKATPSGIEDEAMQVRNGILKSFRVEHISIEHPDADTAHFIVDGIVYAVKRETVRDGIKMLIMESAFYKRFGAGDDELPLIRGSFRANDKLLKGEA